MIFIVYYNIKQIKMKSNKRATLTLSKRNYISNTFSLKCLPSPHEDSRVQLQKTLVYVHKNQRQNQVKQYQWRCKTEFPIVKVATFQVKEINSDKIQFKVEIENCSIKLNELNNVPLFKILYLLKESIIGYERLFHRYGSFLITPSMITLDNENMCKVWINQNYANNHATRTDMNQQSFLLSIYDLFQIRSNRFKNTQLFFQELRQHRTFYSAITFIDNFAKINKIVIPACCKPSQKELSRNIQKTEINSTSISNCPPKFLTAPLLRNTVKLQATNPLLLGFKQQGSINTMVQKSQKTTAQLSDNKSFRTQAPTFPTNILYKNQISQELLSRSHLQPKFAYKINERKFSEQSPQIKMINPENHQKYNCRTPKARWDQNSFIGCEMYEKVQVEGKWNGLNSLFDDIEEMKESVHNGKQKWRISFGGDGLDLLSHYGKQIEESFIKQQHSHYQY